MVFSSPLDQSKFNVELGTFFKPKKFKLFNNESEADKIIETCYLKTLFFSTIIAKTITPMIIYIVVLKQA